MASGLRPVAGPGTTAAVCSQPELRLRQLPLVVHVETAPLLEGINPLPHPFLWQQAGVEIVEAAGTHDRDAHVREPHVALRIPIAVERPRIPEGLERHERVQTT